MSAENKIRWHDNGRGPRVIVPMAGEEHVLGVERARALRDELSAVLDEIGGVAPRPGELSGVPRRGRPHPEGSPMKFRPTTPDTLARDLMLFADWVATRMPENDVDDRPDLAAWLNHKLDQLLRWDAFGTEGQQDPRGDHRE